MKMNNEYKDGLKGLQNLAQGKKKNLSKINSPP